MTHLSPNDIANWVALYAAAGVCCGIALVLSIATSLTQLHRERTWTELRSVRDIIRFLPQTWWRWQRLYLCSTPMTLVIVAAFAATLSWG